MNCHLDGCLRSLSIIHGHHFHGSSVSFNACKKVHQERDVSGTIPLGCMSVLFCLALSVQFFIFSSPVKGC